MIYKSFETYCDKYSDKILSELETEIESLNLPKFVAEVRWISKGEHLQVL